MSTAMAMASPRFSITRSGASSMTEASSTPDFISCRIIQNATPKVTMHMTAHRGTDARMTATVSTPAAVAAISGAP